MIGEEAEVAKVAEVEMVEEKPIADATQVDSQEKEIVVDRNEKELDNEKWTSRWSFILAAVGSAIGLGNFWRFPWLSYKYGGGSFFIPYFLALFFLGIPLIQLELALGQVFHKACTGAFGELHPRWRGIGVGAAMISFGIVVYYTAVLAWGNVYWVESFYSPMPWSIYGKNGSDVLNIPSNHFFGDTLMLGDPNIMSSVFGGMLFMWLCVFLILWKGAEFISKAVWLTVLLPVVMLFILMIVGLIQEGAAEGVRHYIGIWDLSKLNKADMWVDAITQIFFSLSLSSGVMTAYGSMNPRNSNVVKDGAIIAVLNCFFSFLAGFAVFSIAGYFAQKNGYNFDDPEFTGQLKSVGLAFVLYPAGLSLISDGGAANFLCILFFTTFFFLGVDSAFSLVESVVMNLRETPIASKYSKKQMTAAVCALGFLFSIPYCAGIGLFLLDVVDAYLNKLGLVLVGFLECFVAGWVYNRSGAVEVVGGTAMMIFEIGLGGGFCLFTILALALKHTDNLTTPEIIGISVGTGLFVQLSFLVAAVEIASKRTKNRKSSLYHLGFYGVDSLRKRVNSIITEDAPNNMQFHWVWCALIKYIGTPVLFFMLFLDLESKIANGGYSDYGAGYEVIGGLMMAFIFVLIMLGVFLPDQFTIKE